MKGLTTRILFWISIDSFIETFVCFLIIFLNDVSLLVTEKPTPFFFLIEGFIVVIHQLEEDLLHSTVDDKNTFSFYFPIVHKNGLF